MSLPMLSGSCWTKRTTESNRTAPEILRGFFAPYPPADASCRTSGHTPPNPPTAGLPVTQALTHTPQPSSPLSSLSPTPPFPQGSPLQARSQSKARHAPRFPTTQAQTHTPQPFNPLSSPFTRFPIPAWLSYPSPLPKQNPLHPTLPHHAGADPHGPAVQPAIFPVHQLPHPRTSLQPL